MHLYYLNTNVSCLIRIIAKNWIIVKLIIIYNDKKI